MWFPAWLKFPESLSAVICSTVPVHPWTFGAGQQEESGNYLSPSNAVDYLCSKLAGTPGEIEILVFMLSAPQHDIFMTQLSELTALFPLPVFTQVERMANAAADLAITKMQIPGKVGGLPDPTSLSVSTCRTALAAQLISQAKSAASQSASIDSIQADLAAFKSDAEQMLSAYAASLEDLKKGAAAAWVFSAKGPVDTLISELKKDIPEKDSIYTVAALFAAESLDGLKGMVSCRKL